MMELKYFKHYYKRCNIEYYARAEGKASRVILQNTLHNTLLEILFLENYKV